MLGLLMRLGIVGLLVWAAQAHIVTGGTAAILVLVVLLWGIVWRVLRLLGGLLMIARALSG